MCKLCGLLVLALLLISSGLAYKFIYSGKVEVASDGRQSILLSTDERDLVLGEMRGFLAAVQTIIEGAANGDWPAVTAAARPLGLAATQGMPGTLMGKLPLAFKRLGFDTHGKFEQIALDAEQMGDAEHTFDQVADLLQNCVGCHATYRFDAQPGGH